MQGNQIRDPEPRIDVPEKMSASHRNGIATSRMPLQKSTSPPWPNRRMKIEDIENAIPRNDSKIGTMVVKIFLVFGFEIRTMIFPWRCEVNAVTIRA
jgi:hypothetical protein